MSGILLNKILRKILFEKFKGVSVGCALVLVPFGTATQAFSASSKFSTALAYYSEGQMEKAIPIFEEAFSDASSDAVGGATRNAIGAAIPSRQPIGNPIVNNDQSVRSALILAFAPNTSLLYSVKQSSFSSSIAPINPRLPAKPTE